MSTTRTHLTPGTLVRLSLDTNATSVAVVVDLDHVRDDDAMDMVRVDFAPDSEDSNLMTLAADTLTALCSWADEYPDGFGLACSEPGVPTTIIVDCRHDATKRFRWVNSYGSFEETFCTEHTLCAALDAQRAHEPYEVDDLDQ